MRFAARRVVESKEAGIAHLLYFVIHRRSRRERILIIDHLPGIILRDFLTRQTPEKVEIILEGGFGRAAARESRRIRVAVAAETVDADPIAAGACRKSWRTWGAEVYQQEGSIFLLARAGRYVTIAITRYWDRQFLLLLLLRLAGFATNFGN